jgi:hypothetical protein
MGTTMTETRSLGVGGRQLSAVGVGTWALGGPSTFDGRDAGWVRLTTRRASARCTPRSVLTVGPLPQAETAEITALLADSPERR